MRSTKNSRKVYIVWCRYNPDTLLQNTHIMHHIIRVQIWFMLHQIYRSAVCNVNKYCTELCVFVVGVWCGVERGAELNADMQHINKFKV